MQTELKQATVRGIRVPPFLYGTAWKEDATRDLTRTALAAGFRGIDTANQRKHYHEAGVGEALAAAFAAGLLTRDEVFVQTKFTSIGGQDHRLPYDPKSAIEAQVRQSLASSLVHLGVGQLDSFILHGPSQKAGLATRDIAAWRAMEGLYADRQTRLLGISNVDLAQLEELCALASEPPAFVQNRCYARTGWDRAVRAFCSAHGILYQGFSLLTANERALELPAFRAIVRRVGRTPEQIVFRFALELGMICLTGTTSAEHMRADLAVHDLELTPDDVREIEMLAG